MSAGKHTEGPWTVCLSLYDGSVFSFSITASPHGSLLPICEAPSRLLGHNRPPDELEANARLIAAAPDLLAALKVAQLWLDVDGRFDMQGINAAIAKAEGRS